MASSIHPPPTVAYILGTLKLCEPCAQRYEGGERYHNPRGTCAACAACRRPLALPVLADPIGDYAAAHRQTEGK